MHKIWYRNFNFHRKDKYFREFSQEIENCEFVGCTHIKENACGIKNALQEGKISQERYERFCKIYEELKDKEKRNLGPGPKLRKKRPGPFFKEEREW